MQKVCEKTGWSFEVSDMELDLIKKMSLNEPKFHPKVRAAMRLMLRNERNLYIRKCDATGERIMSVYNDKKPFPVYKYDYWISDEWTPPHLDYNPDKSFFEQYKELSLITPRVNLFSPFNENCDYCNAAEKNKNCYMHILSDRSEDCYYTYGVYGCRDLIDCSHMHNCELCFECMDCTDSYHCRGCFLCDNCNESDFCFDCRGCKNCFMCSGLRNQEYCINNKPYSKDDYEEKMKQINLGSYKMWIKILEQFLDQIVSDNSYNRMINVENSTGNFLINAKNCEDCYDLSDAEDCCHVLVGAHRIKDVGHSHSIVHGSQLIYGNVSTTESYNCHNTIGCWATNNSCYNEFLQNCDDCMGCISLKRKKFCILNKQYSEEEYYKIKTQIISELGDYYGNPFPFSVATLSYQDSAFRDHFSLSKEEIDKIGWEYGKPKMPQEGNFMSTTNISDDIFEAPNEINDTFLCEKSKKPFKIIPQEIKLLKTINAPLPRYHHEVRFKKRVVLRKAEINVS